MPRLPRPGFLLFPVITLVAALLAAACSSGSGSSQQPLTSGVTIETVTPSAPVALTSPNASATSSASPAAQASRTAVASPAASTGTPASQGSAPTTGRWIDVDVTRYEVRLMNGTQIVQTIAPIAVGAQVNTGAYESTQTGLFSVYNKIAGLQYDAPYDAYIADWVAFDPNKDNGFHSFLLDADGDVVDAATGRVSNGCIRTGAAKTIFDYAEIGMPVYVHL